MADIKKKEKTTIKKFDRMKNFNAKLKENFIKAKNRTNYNDDDEDNPNDYDENIIQQESKIAFYKGANKLNEYGEKATLKMTENIPNGTKKIKNKVTKKPIKTLEEVTQGVTKKTKQAIKTAEQTGKIAYKTATNTAKATERTTKKVVQVAKATAKAIKTGVKATITAVKKMIEGTKAVITAILAGGWIVVVVILIIVLIGGFIATIFNGNGDNDYDISQIPNSEIVLVAKAQIGNEGGDKFWKWYGFDEYVEWCACFVSWCANECDYIDKGIMPKFSVCTDGINWFKQKNEWHNREESYCPIIGDIIFFDWFDEDFGQDNISDHVGIVTRLDITNKTIYTIEGNTSNRCAERMYSLDDAQIMGYGSPKYEDY